MLGNASFIGEQDEQQAGNSTPYDKSRAARDDPCGDIHDFLRRPVKVYEDQWSPSVVLYDQFYPWNNFLLNPKVSNRINNFKNLRGDLKVKFLINGNPFFSGCAMVCYQPLETFDTLTQNRAFVPQDNVQMSLMPRLFLDPSTSTGGTLSMPFFFPKDYLDITSTQDVLDIGRITVRELNPLKSVNEIIDPTLSTITITAYAWMENVELSGLTHRSVNGLVPQAGNISDGLGTASKIAGSMTSVPGISSFAIASEKALTSMSKIADLLGYCRTPLMKDTTPIRNSDLGFLASTSANEDTEIFALDDCNELSIDPRISGYSSDDEMSISHIAQRETYLTKFTWDPSDSPDSRLFSVAVSPEIHAIREEDGKTYHHLTALAHAAIPFTYWRGKLKFRFQVVASAVHKGRLIFVYDPNESVSTIQTNENANYIKIMDISVDKQLEIEIDINQPTAWQATGRWTLADDSTYFSSVLPVNGTNGSLSVFVVNDLKTPTSDPIVDTSVEINVFVSAGDSFEVARMKGGLESPESMVIKPQAGEVSTTGIETIADENPKSSEDMGQTTVHLGKDDYSVYMGEKIISFRQCLQRMQLHESIPLDDLPGNGIGWTTVSQYAFPLYRGNVPGAVHARLGPAGESIPYNYYHTTLLNWLMPAYTGVRGSIRMKLAPLGTSIGTDTTTLSRLDDFPGPPSRVDWSLQETSIDRRIKQTLNLTKNGATGMAYSKAGLPVKIPYYSKHRFHLCKTPTQYEGTFKYTSGFSALFTHSNFSGARGYVFKFLGAGPDLNLFFYTGMPPVTTESSFPDAFT